jgi:transmembrane protein EpsG
MTLCCCAYVLVVQKILGRRRPSLLGNAPPNILAFLLPVIWFFVVAALQVNYGDTPFYRHSYALTGSFQKPVLRFGAESLFGWVSYIASLPEELERDGIVYVGLWVVFICAALFILPAMLVFYRYAESNAMAIFLFVSLGIYGTSMNGIRQFAATGLMLLGTHFFFHPRWKRALFFLLFVLLAYTFHASALFLIPVFFIVRLRAFSKAILLVILGAAAAVLFSGIIMPGVMHQIEGTTYDIYTTDAWNEGGSTLLRVVISAIPPALAYFHRDRFREMGRSGDILINTSTIIVAINIIGIYDWIFVRLAIYLYVYQILLICKVFSVMKRERGVRHPLVWGLFLMYCVHGWLYGMAIDLVNPWISWLKPA